MGFSLFFDFCCAGLGREAGTSNSDTTATPEKNLRKKRLILIIQESSVRFHGAGLQQKCDAVSRVQSFPALAFLRRYFSGAHGLKSEAKSREHGGFRYRYVVRAQHKFQFRGERGKALYGRHIRVEI